MKSRISRRRALKLSAAATALPLVHIRTAGAAGKLSVAFWTHMVPEGDKVMQKQIDTWANANKVDVHADFISATPLTARGVTARGGSVFLSSNDPHGVTVAGSVTASGRVSA